MTTLHASAASGAPAHVQIKLTDDDARDGELFLILRRDGRFHDRLRAGRTLRRPRHVVSLIDPRRHAPMAFPTVRAAGLPARTCGLLFQRFCKRRRLSEAGAPGVVQLSFEMLNLLAETLILAAQSLTLPLRILSPLAPVGVIRSPLRIVRLRRFRHAAVMPEFTAKYKTR
jgi:hypothetical protein